MGSVGQYTQGWLPWMGNKTNVNFASRNTFTTYLGMGEIETTVAQNDEITWDIWLDTGTWKYAQVYATANSFGIYSVQLDTVQQGTIDGYSSSTVLNVYTEVTGISVTTAGLKNFKLKMTAKNGSSSNYFAVLQSCAWIRTSGTASTPAGSDTPGYTFHHLPWMGNKSNTAWATRTQASTELGGGRLDTDSTAQNNLITDDVWIDTGTYKVAFVHGKQSDQGIYNITGVNGTQTIDGYAAGASSNNYTEVTGITVAAAGTKTIQVQMATKNGSSSAYGGRLNSMAWVRTGA